MKIQHSLIYIITVDAAYIHVKIDVEDHQPVSTVSPLRGRPHQLMTGSRGVGDTLCKIAHCCICTNNSSDNT